VCGLGTNACIGVSWATLGSQSTENSIKFYASGWQFARNGKNFDLALCGNTAGQQ
jgi:hypothetical protein